jgi:hypothetical protein
LENTKDYIERQYYYQKLESSKYYVSINSFWADFALHVIEKGINKPFLT